MEKPPFTTKFLDANGMVHRDWLDYFEGMGDRMTQLEVRAAFAEQTPEEAAEEAVEEPAP